MKKILLLLIVLSFNVYSLQYIGNEKLEVINTNNNITTLYNGENISISGDYEFNLYEYKYVYTPANLLTDFITYIPYITGILFISIIALLLISSIKNP